MLSERHRRTLQDIEKHLAAEDRRMASISRGAQRSERRLRHGIDVALVVSVLSAVLCFALATGTTVGAGTVATALFAVLAPARIRRSQLRPSPADTAIHEVWQRFRTPRGHAPRP